MQPKPTLPPMEAALAVAREHQDLILLALQVYDNLPANLQDLLHRYCNECPTLTSRQADWIKREAKGTDPIALYGDFKAIEVMFQIAGEHLKMPKIRLMTKDDIFVQLNFHPAEERYGKSLDKRILVYRDGWQGHGRRRYIGQIKDAVLYPKYEDNLTDSIITLLQEFSLDPAAVAKASSMKLKACSFCAQRLSDPESKSRGYGPVCAEHYNLPWGKHTPEAREKQRRRLEQLQSGDLTGFFNSGPGGSF